MTLCTPTGGRPKHRQILAPPTVFRDEGAMSFEILKSLEIGLGSDTLKEVPTHFAQNGTRSRAREIQDPLITRRTKGRSFVT